MKSTALFPKRALYSLNELISPLHRSLHAVAQGSALAYGLENAARRRPPPGGLGFSAHFLNISIAPYMAHSDFVTPLEYVTTSESFLSPSKASENSAQSKTSSLAGKAVPWCLKYLVLET